MSDREICVLYRGAKNKGKQLQILSELACRTRNEIIGILLRNGEELPPAEIKKLYKRLDNLEKQIAQREKEIAVMEKEYREIASAINGGE